MSDTSQSYERDGVEYWIEAVQDEGGYFGRWYCPACGEHGESSVKDASEKDALRGAKTNLGGHHYYRHKLGNK